jgi:hypothetical protein
VGSLDASPLRGPQIRVRHRWHPAPPSYSGARRRQIPHRDRGPDEDLENVHRDYVVDLGLLKDRIPRRRAAPAIP